MPSAGEADEGRAPARSSHPDLPANDTFPLEPYEVPPEPRLRRGAESERRAAGFDSSANFPDGQGSVGVSKDFQDGRAEPLGVDAVARDVGRERYVVDFDSGGSPSLRPPARLAEQLADHREAPAVGDGGEGTPIREN